MLPRAATDTDPDYRPCPHHTLSPVNAGHT